MTSLIKKTVLLALFTLSSLAFAQNNLNADIYGKWKIKAQIGSGAASTLTQRDVEKLIGKYVIISATTFTFNGRVCAHPHYSRSTEETVQFFDAAWKADVSDIPLPNPVTIIETGCNTLFPIRAGHLMIAEENVFLEAVRVDDKASRPPGTSRK